jgi:phospholipase D3/4
MQPAGPADVALLSTHSERKPCCARIRRHNLLVAALSVGAIGGGAYAVWSQVIAPGGSTVGCFPTTLTLVQSIPVGDFDIEPVPGSLATHEALIAIADAATHRLDFTAMYMDLLGADDRRLYNDSQMESFGAGRGAALTEALNRTAARGVAIRILLGTLTDPLKSVEVRQLLTYPNVQARTWNATRWYKGGIMHMKVWHAEDDGLAYIGSANADWKSLAQVKEVGVLINGSKGGGGGGGGGGATADLGRLFEIFWRWADPLVAAQQVVVFSDAYQCELTLPPWDPAAAAQRVEAAAPFDLTGAALAALSSVSKQQQLCLPSDGTEALSDADARRAEIGSPAAEAFLSASPGGALTPGRTPDIDALVYTVHSASTTLCLSVMDFVPASAYTGGHGGAPLWWPALFDAVLSVAYAKPVQVRILVSTWAHTSAEQPAAMRWLSGALASCAQAYQRCAGTLDVRQYLVPGWNETTTGTHVSVGKRWPSFTRVNHAKYIVSDSRVNIGTSNWAWGYFHQTAGASFNTNASGLVNAAQEVFDRDWASAYAAPL